MNLLYLAIGGIFGTLSRYGCVKLLEIIKIPNIANISPAIMIINIIGSLLFAAILYFAKSLNLSEHFKLLIFTGFLGSFTTYSTFIYELSILIKAKAFLYAASYLGLSLIIPLLLMVFFLIKIA